MFVLVLFSDVLCNHISPWKLLCGNIFASIDISLEKVIFSYKYMLNCNFFILYFLLAFEQFFPDTKT